MCCTHQTSGFLQHITDDNHQSIPQGLVLNHTYFVGRGSEWHTWRLPPFPHRDFGGAWNLAPILVRCWQHKERIIFHQYGGIGSASHPPFGHYKGVKSASANASKLPVQLSHGSSERQKSHQMLVASGSSS